MRNRNKNNIFERLALFLSGRPGITLSIFLTVCFLFGFLIFNHYVIRLQEKDFEYDPEVKTANYQLYDKVAIQYGLIEEDLSDESEKEVEDEEGAESEVVADKEDISDEELEEVLADTLFDLYEFTEGSFPTISERAIVWQDLGLGSADNYRGTRRQNIEFLERLKEEMDNTDKDEKSN